MSVASPERDPGHHLAKKFRLQLTSRFYFLFHRAVKFNTGEKLLFIKQSF